jgi:hypothetical protein
LVTFPAVPPTSRTGTAGRNRQLLKVNALTSDDVASGDADQAE